MPIDTSIQFNGHNSYRVTESVWCEPFGVEGMTFVTHSFNAYAGSALTAATRARTKFFAVDGSVLGTTDHPFTVGVIFDQVDITVAVPVGSKLCQLSFLPSGTWWIAEPKSEEGQSATPYNTNYQGQLSMITPDGAYLGMLTTNQIVVSGSLANPGERLDNRLVTINNNAINLSATSADQGSRLTTVEAGQITLTNTTASQGTAITNIQAGIITVNGSSSFATGYDPTSKETPTGAQAKATAAQIAATAVANTAQGTANTAAANAATAQSKLDALSPDGLIEFAKLGTTVISGGYLQTVFLDANKITAGILSADRIAAKSISGAKMADGTVGDLQIAATGISATKITTGILSADRIAAGSITVDKLAAGAVVTDRLSDPDDPDSYMELGRNLDYAAVKFLADGSEYLRIEADPLMGMTEIKGNNFEAMLMSNSGQSVNLWSAQNKIVFANENTKLYELVISDAGIQIFRDGVLRWTQT